MKFLNITGSIMAIVSLSVFAACDKSAPETPTTDALAIEWAANPDFAPMEISDEMDIDIRITAEAGIKSFVVSVNSHAISPSICLFTSDGTANMDLINDQKIIAMLTIFGIDLPTGDQLLDKTEVHFSLSSLVPMIADVSGKRDHDTNHIFTLNMTDNENRNLSKSLTFHYSYAE